MKETQRIIKGLVACGMALAMVSTLAAQTSDQVAKVVRIKGSARYSTTGTSEWKPLKTGAELAPGTLIQTDTDPASYVDLILGQISNENEVLPVVYNANTSSSASGAGYTGHESKATQNIVRLSANTLLSVDKLTLAQTGADPASETELDLRTGTIVGRVKKISAGSRFEVKVPNGVAAIRGTDFRISTVDQHHASGPSSVLGVEVWVASGSVVVSWTVAGSGTPLTMVIRPNQIFSSITGQVEPMTPAQHASLGGDLNSFPVVGGNPVLQPIQVPPQVPNPPTPTSPR